MAHPCAGFRPCASLVPAGRTHNITHDIMRPFLPADCSKMTRDLQKSPVSRVVETAPSQVRGGFFVRYTQAGLLTQTFKRTSPSSRNKHPSDIAERHSANTATALCGILTRLPFSPTTIGWTPVYQLYSLVFLFYQGALGMSRWNKRKYV